jgi:MYXO-CTERM domain-containing protein
LPLSALLAAAPALAQAAPASIKLSWASPDASTTIALTWVTATNQSTTIEYGINAVGENMLTANPPLEIVGIGWFHEIELTGLSPDTTYKYRVGTAGDWSPEYTFKTAPNDGCTPFTFVQLGDARSQDGRGPSRNWSSIHQEASMQGAQFILNGGDLVKEGQEIGQWAQWLVDSELINPFVPMMPAMGNHDDGPGEGLMANYNMLFALPVNSVTGTEDYYYFVYNNLVVFSLSTQTYSDWAAQMQWLEDISAMHAEKWKVAFFHHPVYTTTSFILHPPNEKGQNEFYGPSFDEAGIDIVFQSHNHIYERFRPLRFDPADVEQGVEVASYGNGPSDGRLYVVSGGAGAFLDISVGLASPAVGSELRLADHHFMKIGIAGNTLTYSAIKTTAGNSSGGGDILDQVTITRPGMDPCNNPQDPDGDGDGYPQSSDCRDDDASINPGAAELCGNQVDEDCNNVAEECPDPPVDMDGDGSPADSDCDDQDAQRFPENTEAECDGIDNDCDCNELCNGVESDLCAAADAGTHPDAAAPEKDAGADGPAPDAGGSATADSGTPADLTPIETSDCGCTTTASHRDGLLLVIGLLLIVRRARRRT